MMIPQYLTAAECAELLDLKLATFQKRIDRGTLTQGRKIGRRRMFYVPFLLYDLERNGVPVSDTAAQLRVEFADAGLYPPSPEKRTHNV